MDNNKRYEKAVDAINELKAVANRIFSTEDGKKFATVLFRTCRLFKDDDYRLSADIIRYYKAQQDLINRYITNLVDKDVLINIFNYEDKNDRKNNR